MPTTLYDPTEIEYLDGRPHPKVSPKLTHGLVQAALLMTINHCAGGRGIVVPEVRFDPGAIDRTKTEFVPDLAFISNERRQELVGDDREKPPFSPDIAVEVRSPSDDRRYLERKIARYLRTGSVLVLDVDPYERRIIVHDAHGAREFSSADRFEHPTAPWLIFDVAAIFAELGLQ